MSVLHHARTFPAARVGCLSLVEVVGSVWSVEAFVVELVSVGSGVVPSVTVGGSAMDSVSVVAIAKAIAVSVVAVVAVWEAVAVSSVDAMSISTDQTVSVVSIWVVDAVSIAAEMTDFGLVVFLDKLEHVSLFVLGDELELVVLVGLVVESVGHGAAVAVWAVAVVVVSLVERSVSVKSVDAVAIGTEGVSLVEWSVTIESVVAVVVAVTVVESIGLCTLWVVDAVSISTDHTVLFADELELVVAELALQAEFVVLIVVVEAMSVAMGTVSEFVVSMSSEGVLASVMVLSVVAVGAVGAIV